MLREMVRDWTKEYVEPQAHQHDKAEKFNLPLMRSMGELGLLGISAPEEYGGAGMDAVACTIVHEELSASDPGFTLAYLAHSMLFVNNLAYNGNEDQKQRILPKVCSGEWIGAMAMSEPDAGTDVLGLTTSAVSKMTVHGFSTAGKCGLPMAVLTKRERPQMSYGSMPEQEKTSVGASNSPPSW